MTKSKATFLPPQIPAFPHQNTSGCSSPWPMPVIPNPHWPWEFAQEGLAFRIALDGVRQQLPAIMKLSPENQEAYVASTLDGLKEKGLLSEHEIEALRGIGSGREFDIPPFNPDGSPSLCGVLGKKLAPTPERSTSSAIVGAVIGAGLGSVCGPIGAMAGAAAGGLVGDLLV